MLVSKEFLWLMVIAVVIASPLAWMGMNKWLQNFAYRIDVSPWVILLAGVIAFVVALGTISLQAIRAALANPVKSLRSE
jgi:putative ABC transport system permease protein